MSPSPRAPRSPSKSPSFIPADADAAPTDPMDVIIGIVAAVAIPGIVFGLLTVVLGGGDSAADTMRRNDELGNLNPPVSYREVEMRIARVESLLNNQVVDYMRRANTAEDNHEKNQWQELAFAVLGTCKSDLEAVESSIPKSAELQRHPQVGQAIDRWKAHINSEVNKIRNDTPFPDRY